MYKVYQYNERQIWKYKLELIIHINLFLKLRYWRCVTPTAWPTESFILIDLRESLRTFSDCTGKENSISRRASVLETS